jgi:hypothetical protein
MGDDVVFIFDKENEAAGDFTTSVYNSLRQWLGVNVREPRPKDRAAFDVKTANITFVITPGVFSNEQVREGLEGAIATKKNIVFLHHIRSNCNLEEEVGQAPEECKKAVDKALKDHKVVIYADDLAEECNDMLMTKWTLKEPELQQASFQKRMSDMNIVIMKNSAKISKARSTAGVRRKYDLCITAAKPEVSGDGMPVLVTLFDTVTKLAPALSVCLTCELQGQPTTMAMNANVTHSFNLIVVLSKDSLKCPHLLEEIKLSLENEGNILLVHHLISCPDIKAELDKCEDQVLASCLARSHRFTYIEEGAIGVVAGILQPGTVKTDDTKSPRTRQALSSGGPKMASFRLDYKNNFALELAGDGTGQVYNSKFSEKKKDLPADIDTAIKGLFELHDPEKKGMINWAQFAEIDRIVTECLGGQYNEMISRRAFSMMNYPGLTLESEISYTTFHNYHSFVAKQMGALDGDREANVHYKYIVDKVKTAKKGKRFLKHYDLFITHDRSKAAVAFATLVRASIDKHTPNIRAVACTDQIIKEQTTKLTTYKEAKELAASSLNVLVLLQEDCLMKPTVKEEVLAAVHEGAQVMVMCNLENSPMLEREIRKSDADLQQALARPAVVEYWEKCDAACCCKLLELMQFPVDNATKRPLPNKEVTFRKRDNPAVLYCYQTCDEDTEAVQAFQAIANMVSPISRSAQRTREDFLRDGGLEILKERFSQYNSVGAVAEVACRSIASLSQHTGCAEKMAELGIVKCLVEAIGCHGDNAILNGEACRALVNMAQDDTAKAAINGLGGFQLMLQSQKRFEFNPEFWEMRWGMKEMETDQSVMVNYCGKGRWCSAKIIAVNKGNGTYDVTYSHGGMDRRVPAQWVRPKDKTDQIEEFVAVWQWKPNGKLTVDELNLKSDGMLTLKSQGLGAAGTWSTSVPKGGGRNIVKLNLSGEVSSIDMERISLTTLRAVNSPHRAVLKDEHDDCLYVSYYSFKEGVLGTKCPNLMGRAPDLTRSEQQVLWAETPGPWTGLPDKFKTNYATRWMGLLEISKMGDYKIFLEANTGARMWVNDMFLGDSPCEKELHLLAGPQNLVVDYFCKTADSKMIQMFYSGPDTSDEKVHVPVSVLQHNIEDVEVVPKPGFIAEYFPEVYENNEIPEGVDPDILRIEKQLDFDEISGPWQGLPKRYSGGFTARFNSYIHVTCGEARKAKYKFNLESGKKGILYVNDEKLVQNDETAEIELKKGRHHMRVEFFCNKGESHGLKLLYTGPETGTRDIPQPDGADPLKEPLEILVPPTATQNFILPNFAVPKGDPLTAHPKPVISVLWSNQDKQIASVGTGGRMFIWDPPTGKWLHEMIIGSTVTSSTMALPNSPLWQLTIPTTQLESLISTRRPRK